MALAAMAILARQANTEQPELPAIFDDDRVIAIDVLLVPDATMWKMAVAANARLRDNYPQGYTLGHAHVPHITLVQRYVRAKDLEAIAEAVAEVVIRQDPRTLQLDASRYDYAIWSGVAITSIVVERTPELDRLQQAIVRAVESYAVSDGTAAAFSRSKQLPRIDDDIVEYVKVFVPKASGENFKPHVTVGVAHEDFVKQMQAEPFERFTFKPASLAIYQLGNFGTAQKKLWEWKPPVRGKIVDAISEGSWMLVKLNGKPVDSRDISLEFDAKARRAAGSTGVNRWSGGYELSGKSLEFGPLVTTRRAGPPEAMQLEGEFTQALESVTHVAGDAERLILSEGDKERLVFERSRP
jgi:heat shock protein HslJ